MDKFKAYLLALLVFLFAFFIGETIRQEEKSRLESEAREAVAVAAGDLRSVLETELNSILYLTRGLQSYIQATKGRIPEEVTAMLVNIYEEGRIFRNIGVAPDNRIKYVYPLVGNERVLGLYYPDLPNQWPAVERAIKERKATLAGPIKLAQGGCGLIYRLPVFLNDNSYWGIISSVINTEQFFNFIKPISARHKVEFALRGKDGLGENGEAFWGNLTIFNLNPLLLDINIPGGKWQLAALARPKSEVNNHLIILRIITFVVAISLAGFTFITFIYYLKEKELLRSIRITSQALQISNAELEQFAYAISHDLQAPLRNIINFLQLIKRKYKEKLDADADEYIDFAVKGGQQMNQMIRDLLEYSRVKTKGHKFEPTDINLLVAEAIEILQLHISETNAKINVGTLPIINTDARQIIRIFQNLIDNSIKYHNPDTYPEINISAENNGKEWIFKIKDNGIGIPAADQQRIFNVFQRLHGPDEFSGSGIGLSICQKIIERHGGKIWVNSPGSGMGAEFCFTLPIND